MTRTISGLLTVCVLAAMTSHGHAAMYTNSLTGWADSVGTGALDGPPGPATVTLSGITEIPTGPGVLRVDIAGNFSSQSENFTLAANPSGTNHTFGGGAILDNNTGNDDFDFNSGNLQDQGFDFSNPPQSGEAIIPLAILNSLLSDNGGTIDFLFTFNGFIANNNVNQVDESITVTLTFPTAPVNGVPEPSAFILGGMAALMLGVAYVYRRRRRQAA